jgi:hypothetical protein
METHRLQYQLKSVYDVLPTPTNLATWDLTDDPNCKLCRGPANLEHLLSSCSVALKDGQYTWHDKVLPVLADTLEKNRRKPNRDKGRPNFVKAREEFKRGSARKWTVGQISGALCRFHPKRQLPTYDQIL